MISNREWPPSTPPSVRCLCYLDLRECASYLVHILRKEQNAPKMFEIYEWSNFIKEEFDVSKDSFFVLDDVSLEKGSLREKEITQIFIDRFGQDALYLFT